MIQAQQECPPMTDLTDARWLWAVRELSPDADYEVINVDDGPNVGDVVVVRVKKISNHTKIMTRDSEQLRLYPDDLLVGVMGNRYATDAFEAEVLGTDNLNILTAAGMMGTVLSVHAKKKKATEVEFVGYLHDENGRINMKQRLFHPNRAQQEFGDLILVLGTGMNSGKTTVAAKLVRALAEQSHCVATGKLTGSVSHRDLYELFATLAIDVRDFSDYGFPSTYLCSRDELIDLFYTMMNDGAKSEPQLTVLEIADGILQRETEMLLADEELKRHVKGIVLSAFDSSSALYGAKVVQDYGHHVIGVSGLLTNSPLFIREFSERSDIPVVSSVGRGDELAQVVKQHLVEVN